MGKIEEIRNLQIGDIIGRYITLRRDGIYLVSPCPFHKEENPSFKINTQKNRWRCHAGCGGGDAIDFVKQFRKISVPEAINEIMGNTNSAPVTVFAPKKSGGQWEPITPAPSDAGQPDFFNKKHGKPSGIWTYRNASGKVIGYTARFDLPGNEKEVLPLVFAQNKTTGKREWRWMIFGAIRPMYGIDRLAAAPAAPVLLVEGEKTADAAGKLFPKMAVVTWPGGTNAIDKIDLSPMDGRIVVIAPDNDAPGWKAAAYISGKIKPAALSFLIPPANFPKGWDLADADFPNPEAAKVWAQSNRFKELPARDFSPPKPEPVAPPPPTQQASPEPPPPSKPGPVFENEHFRFLGFDTNEKGSIQIFIFSKNAQKVFSFSPSGISKGSILALAQLQWWEMEFPSRQRGVNIELITSWMLNVSIQRGIYDPAKIRGRGAWIDQGRVIVHAGDHLIVDGRAQDIASLQTKFIYELSQSLEIPSGKPATNLQCLDFLNMLKGLCWERPISAYLLAGWVVIAPICGALKWRSHIWITGAAGTGKSWVLSVVKKMLGKMFVDVEGSSSEAGIRQTLHSDAMPVVLDESEASGRGARERMQAILDLMRSASTEGSGAIVKGSGVGKSSQWLVRTCFCFSSIAVQLKNKADKSRVSLLALQKDRRPDKDSRWKTLESETYPRIVTEEFVQAFQSRTISMIPVILENAKIFTAVAGTELGEQRTGDQIGTLLAGAYSLVSSKVISRESAAEWIRAQNWNEEKELTDENDENKLFTTIMGAILRVPNGAGGATDRQIATLCLTAAGKVSGDHITPEAADEELRRHGVKVHDGRIYIGFSIFLGTLLRDTGWEAQPGRLLSRMPGAENISQTTFAPGIRLRAVSLPLSVLPGGEDVSQIQQPGPEVSQESDYQFPF